MTRKILFTSPGRRVELISLFKKTRPEWHLLGADSCNTSPADYFLERVYNAPPLDDGYAPHIFDICLREKVDCVVPLIDPELPLLSRDRRFFNEAGIKLLVPSYEMVQICRDKFETWSYFSGQGVSLPKTWRLSDFLESGSRFEFNKMMLKPARGSASAGAFPVTETGFRELVSGKAIDASAYIIQQFIDFDREITVDVFGDGNGGVVEYCQRERIKTRGGEVERGVTVDYPEVKNLIMRISSILPFHGVVNVQIMISKEGCLLGEINPRFGGGYPLAHAAGANFIEHIDALLEGREYPDWSNRRYKTGLYVLRYDNAVYTDKLLNLC